MSTPPDPAPPPAPPGPGQPTTQEIPVAPGSARTTVQQLPPPSASAAWPAPAPAAAASPGPAPADPLATASQPTGPVDLVPGLPGSGGAAPAEDSPAEPQVGGASASSGAAEGGPGSRTATAGAGLVVLSLVLLQFGLSLDFGTVASWSALPLWSLFATACVVLGVAPFLPALSRSRRLDRQLGRRIAAGGLGGLAVFWVLVVLPNADSDRGFLHTAALAALGGAVWLATNRHD